MATLDQLEAQRAGSEETWELTVPGRVHVQVLNHLGRPKNITVVGRGRKLRISTLDRELAEERIVNRANNPFQNGMLVRIDKDAPEPESPEAIGDDDLKQLFDSSDSEFEAVLADLGELNLRRLLTLAENSDKATVSQQSILKTQLDTRFPIGGTVPSYEEAMHNPIGGN